MNAIRFLADTLLGLLALAFLLRLMFQWVRADFRDPYADAIVRVTNWLVLPLRRVLPPIRRIDTATVVAVVIVAAARTGVRLALDGFGGIDPAAFLVLLVNGLAIMVLRVYLVAMLLYWLSGFVASGGHAPGFGLVARLCEPPLRRIRRAIPPIGRVDFSALWATLAILAALMLLHGA
ncbi:MAG: YggT family protein [Gammaproteobacteria bacterium]|nr:YggT family protein [Gammaproteobacteria bacterium]